MDFCFFSVAKTTPLVAVMCKNIMMHTSSNEAHRNDKQGVDFITGYSVSVYLFPLFIYVQVNDNDEILYLLENYMLLQLVSNNAL